MESRSHRVHHPRGDCGEAGATEEKVSRSLGRLSSSNPTALQSGRPDRQAWILRRKNYFRKSAGSIRHSGAFSARAETISRAFSSNDCGVWTFGRRQAIRRVPKSVCARRSRGNCRTHMGSDRTRRAQTIVGWAWGTHCKGINA